MPKLQTSSVRLLIGYYRIRLQILTLADGRCASPAKVGPALGIAHLTGLRFEEDSLEHILSHTEYIDHRAMANCPREDADLSASNAVLMLLCVVSARCLSGRAPFPRFRRSNYLTLSVEEKRGFGCATPRPYVRKKRTLTAPRGHPPSRRNSRR